MAKKRKQSQDLLKKTSEFKGKVIRTQKGKPEYGTQDAESSRHAPKKQPS